MKKNILKVLKIITVIILLLLPLSLISINSELIVGDELWNFQNITKTINGGKMYVDCNIIITPIFYLIGYCFVRILTGTILGFRIYNIFTFLILLLSSFYLFISLKISKYKSALYTLLIFLFVMPYISVGANYNILAEIVFILGVSLFLNKDKIKLYNFCQGLVIFACIFTKQNIGIYYSIALIVAEILVDKNESVHYIIREFMVAIICTLISVLIMCLTGCFEGFLNYSFLGMTDFATKNFSIQNTVEIVIIGYISIAICSYILGFLLSIQNNELSKDLRILGIFSIFLNFAILPIANLYHTSFAILLNVVIFIYIFENLLFYKLNKKITLGIIICLAYIAINSYGIICGYRASKNIKIYNKDNIYFSSNMTKELNEKLKDVTDYINKKEKEGIDVVCISADAPLYMIYMKKDHQQLDLCFNGNLGYNGTQVVIDKIKNLKNTEILINKGEYWQENEEIKSYVRENSENIGEIKDLSIYKVN